MMNYRVLVADDERQIRKLVMKACRDLNWEVDEAGDGDEALEVMQKRSHHVFLLDMRMPGLTGLELAKRIVHLEEAPAILIMTGFPDVDNAVEVLKEGVLDYLQKPIAVQALKEALIRAANYHERRLQSIRAQRAREESVRNVRETNERFCAMLELSNDMIFFVDIKSGGIIDCNATAYERSGYSRQELLARQFKDIAVLDAIADWNSFVAVLRSKRHLVVEGTQCTKSGDLNPVEFSFSHTYLLSGEFITVVARDITERKKAEADLEEARRKVEIKAQKLRTIIEGLKEGVACLDESDAITEANQGFLNAIRMPREMVIDLNFWNLAGIGLPLELCNIVEGYKKGKLHERKMTDGEILGKPFSIRISPIIGERGYDGLVINLIDVEDLVYARQKAEDDNRLKTQFLTQIASEMKTQVDGILQLSSLLKKATSDERSQSLLRTIDDFALSLNALIDDVKQHSENPFEMELES